MDLFWLLASSGGVNLPNGGVNSESDINNGGVNSLELQIQDTLEKMDP